uniref:Uncharacterized protein n=1 Tax=Arundo donax TaxID=35708 RepID=A0A0A8Z2Q7_ARUDO
MHQLANMCFFGCIR